MTEATRRNFMKGTLGALGLAVAGPLECSPRRRPYSVEPLDPSIATGPLAGLDLDQNIGRITLDLERRFFPVADSCYELLDEIIETVKRKVDTTENPEDILNAIARLLENDFGYSYEKTSRLSEALSSEKRKMDCDTGSLVYLTIGEELGFPLRAVSTPHHFFVRWHDDQTILNWETTCGEVRSDQFYKDYFNIAEGSIHLGAYMQSLSRPELLAIGMNYIGWDLDMEKRSAEAVTLYKRAIDLNPRDPTLWLNQSAAQLNSGNNLGALQSCTRAMDLYLNQPELLVNKAKALTNLGKYPEAYEALDHALILLPSSKFQDRYGSSVVANLLEHHQWLKEELKIK